MALFRLIKASRWKDPVRVSRIQEGWKPLCFPGGSPHHVYPQCEGWKPGDWVIEPDDSYPYQTVWPDKLFRANFEPVGEEAEELLNPPKEEILPRGPYMILYESRGHGITLQSSKDGIWIRFKSPQKEGCLNLTVRGPILQEVLEDFVEHLGLETPS